MELQASHGACLGYSPNIDSQPSLRVPFDYTAIAIHNQSCQRVKKNSLFALGLTDFKELTQRPVSITKKLCYHMNNFTVL